MLVRTFFSLSYFKDAKSLPGFVKGGRNKVPKEFNDYCQELISGWSEQVIKEHIEAVATKSKNLLEISARNFNTPVYGSGAGAFECDFFNYDFGVTQSEDDFGQCIFTGILEVKNLERFNEIEDVIDNCFNFTFDKVVCVLPKNDRSIKELIYSLDDNKKLLNGVFEFFYENDFSSFQLVHKKNGQIIAVDNNQIEIKFKVSTPILEMIKALKEVNTNIYTATSQEYHLLVQGKSE